MIDIELLRKIVDKGLDANYYLAIYLKSINILDYDNLVPRTIKENLIWAGYFTIDYGLTPKSIALLKELGIVESKQNSPNFDYKALFSLLKEELAGYTGKAQKVLKTGHSFMPNYADFETKLGRVVKKYKLSDFNRVKICLINYIAKCNSQKWEYCQLLNYYIEKNGSSSLSTDYENFIEKEEVKLPKTKQIFI